MSPRRVPKKKKPADGEKQDAREEVLGGRAGRSPGHKKDEEKPPYAGKPTQAKGGGDSHGGTGPEEKKP